MEWIQIGVLILAGTGSNVTPSTSTGYSETFSTLEMCEGDILRMLFNENSSVKKMKTSSVFVEDEYKQIVVSKPVNLVGYGEGVIHFSCVPISE